MKTRCNLYNIKGSKASLLVKLLVEELLILDESIRYNIGLFIKKTDQNEAFSLKYFASVIKSTTINALPAFQAMQEFRLIDRISDSELDFKFTPLSQEYSAAIDYVCLLEILNEKMRDYGFSQEIDWTTRTLSAKTWVRGGNDIERSFLTANQIKYTRRKVLIPDYAYNASFPFDQCDIDTQKSSKTNGVLSRALCSLRNLLPSPSRIFYDATYENLKEDFFLIDEVVLDDGTIVKRPVVSNVLWLVEFDGFISKYSKKREAAIYRNIIPPVLFWGFGIALLIGLILNYGGYTSTNYMHPFVEIFAIIEAVYILAAAVFIFETFEKAKRVCQKYWKSHKIK